MRILLVKRQRKFRGTDLVPEKLPDIDWSCQSAYDVAQELFRIVETRTIASINWYLAEKERKAFWSRALRIMAVIGAAFGAVTPLLAQMSAGVSLIWGYLALGFAALAIGIDKALGFSSTWLRYMRTATRLQQVLYHAQLEWADLSVKRSKDSEEKFNIGTTWIALTNLSDQVNEIVRAETDEWSADVRSQIYLMETQAKAHDS
jgi:hypothetical protein